MGAFQGCVGTSLVPGVKFMALILKSVFSPDRIAWVPYGDPFAEITELIYMKEKQKREEMDDLGRIGDLLY